MCDADMLELLTEGSQEDREKAFKQMGDGLYRCLNSMGEEQKECILINEHLIEDDKEWWSEQGNAKIDMELACKYQKVLEERFYRVLLSIERLDRKVKQLGKILRDKKHPELQYKEEDTEEIKMVKDKRRADVFGAYSGEIREKILQEFLKPGCEPSDIENNGKPHFLRDNMLFNCRKGGTGYIKKVREKVNAVIQESYVRTENITDEIRGKNIEASMKESKKKEARRCSCEFIFLKRDWDVQLWIELIFLKFYKEVEKNKRKLKSVNDKSLEERRIWISEKSKQWFVEQENKYSWKLTEKAVMELKELEDQEKKLDLLNYIITVNMSMNPEINMIITHSDVDKLILDLEMGYSKDAREITKRLQQKEVKGMNPYVATLLWKKSNVSFGELFQFTANEVTLKDRKVIHAYREAHIPENSFAAIALELEHMEAKPYKRDFWYMPKRDAKIARVCIELFGSDRIKCIVEYASFIVEPLVIELPYSNAMDRIANLKDDKVAQMLELAGFETKESLMRYCADMMVRNYCREYFAIPYEVFQRIKCYANVTITVYPLEFHKPDGSIQVGYAGEFMRNQMTRFGGNGYIEIYEDQVWQDQEALEKDWEEVREKMGVLLKEEWLKDNASKKYYSEYAMQQPDFFEYIYKEKYIVEESDVERIMQKIRSGEYIHC